MTTTALIIVVIVFLITLPMMYIGGRRTGRTQGWQQGVSDAAGHERAFREEHPSLKEAHLRAIRKSFPEQFSAELEAERVRAEARATQRQSIRRR